MTLALQPSDFNLEFRQRPVHTLSAPFQKTDPYPWFISRHFLKVSGTILNPIIRLYFIRGSATRLLSPYLAIIALRGWFSFTLYIAKIIPLADVPFCCDNRREMCHFQHTFYRLYNICYICYVGLFDGLCVCVHYRVFGIHIPPNVNHLRFECVSVCI